MGNISRDTFDELKHYVGVRLQQGVPLVDADWNEQDDIRRYELRRFLKRFVGDGVPRGEDGFAIGPVGENIKKIGVPVKALNLRRAWPNPIAVTRLARWLKQAAPNVIQTWMYHANLLGGLAGTWGGKIPIAWNLRNTVIHPEHTKRGTIWAAKVGARGFPSPGGEG